MENKQADVGRDGRTRLARETIFSGANGDREISLFPVQQDHGQNGDKEIFLFPVQPTTIWIDKFTRLIYTLLLVIFVVARRGLPRKTLPRPGQLDKRRAFEGDGGRPSEAVVAVLTDTPAFLVCLRLLAVLLVSWGGGGSSIHVGWPTACCVIIFHFMRAYGSSAVGTARVCGAPWVPTSCPSDYGLWATFVASAAAFSSPTL